MPFQATELWFLFLDKLLLKVKPRSPVRWPHSASKLHGVCVWCSSASIHPLPESVHPFEGFHRWSWSQLTLGERQGFTPNRSAVSSQGRHTESFTPVNSSELTINLTCMCLDCGRKPEHPDKTHTERWRSNTALSSWEAAGLTAAPLSLCCVLTLSNFCLYI